VAGDKRRVTSTTARARHSSCPGGSLSTVLWHGWSIVTCHSSLFLWDGAKAAPHFRHSRFPTPYSPFTIRPSLRDGRPLLIFAIHDSLLPIRYSLFARLSGMERSRGQRRGFGDGWSLVTRHSSLCSLGASCSSLATCHSSLGQ